MKKTLLILSSILVGSGLVSAASFGTSPNSTSQFEKCGIELTPSQVSDIRANAPTRSEDESFLDFSYAGDVYTAYSMNNISSGYVYLAVKIPVEDQTPYIGAQIKGVTIYSPTNQSYTNPIKTAKVFVTDDMSQAPAETTTVSLSSSGFGANYVELEQPFTINGDKPIFIGYRFKYAVGTYYVVVDGIPVASGAPTCLVAAVSSETATPTFSNYSDEMGSLCLRARIFGDNLPTNLISVNSFEIPEYIAPDKDFTFKATVKNMGCNAVGSAQFKETVGENEYSTDYEFASPLGVGEQRSIELKNIPNNTPGVFTVSLTPVSANGVTIEDPATLTSASSSFTSDLSRTVVVEEATGNWCQYCPRGIVMMEYLKETYPDWVLIAVHGGSTSEPMQVPGYKEWLNKYVPGFPYAIANRSAEVDVAADNASYYTPIQDYFESIPGYITPSIEAFTSDDGESIEVTAKTNFIFDTDVKHNLSLVIVEDNVGPYGQANYYYHKAGLPQWYDIPSGTKILFNEVARAIIPDIDAYPDQIVKDNEYSYSTTMPLSYTYGKQPDNKAGTVINPENARVVALVTNAVSGSIVGACETSVNVTGVKGAVSDDVKVSVSVESGSIIVKGADDFTVYTLDGRQVSAKDVPAGIYIVKTEGKSFKVMVR